MDTPALVHCDLWDGNVGGGGARRYEAARIARLEREVVRSVPALIDSLR